MSLVLLTYFFFPICLASAVRYASLCMSMQLRDRDRDPTPFSRHLRGICGDDATPTVEVALAWMWNCKVDADADADVPFFPPPLLLTKYNQSNHELFSLQVSGLRNPRLETLNFGFLTFCHTSQPWAYCTHLSINTVL